MLAELFSTKEKGKNIMAIIQSFPVISSDGGILFTQDENNNIAISVDETITAQGNEFNGASQLVRLDSNSKLPAIDGSNLTGIASGVDADLSNLTSTGKEVVANLGMPSNTYIDLTLGSSGSTYTAPANGYLSITLNSSAAGGSIYITDANNTYLLFEDVAAQYHYWGGTISIRKNQTVTYHYSNMHSAVQFRFTYAQGEV